MALSPTDMGAVYSALKSAATTKYGSGLNQALNPSNPDLSTASGRTTEMVAKCLNDLFNKASSYPQP